MVKRVVALTIEYRKPVMTIACIESLLSEGIAYVLVVDNSDDGGVSAATLRAHFAYEPRVELLESERNIGFAAGMNLGLAWLSEKEKSSPTLLVNNDAILIAGALSAMLAALDRDPTASMVYPTLMHAGRPLGLTYYHRMTGFLSRRPWPGSFPFVSGCCLLLSANPGCGVLFDDTFFMYGEDVELSWRLARQNMHVSAAVDAMVTHVGSAASGVGTEFYETHMVAGHLILAKRLSTGRLSQPALLVCRAVTLTVRATIRCVRFRSLAPFVALGRGALIAFRALRRPVSRFL